MQEADDRSEQARGHGAKLDRVQELAIACLMTHPNIPAAAEAAGVSQATLYRWMKLPDFAAELKDARRAVLRQAVIQLQKATGQAVETLLQVMEDREESGSARVAAARTIIDMSLKAAEIDDLEARIEALEQAKVEAEK